MTDGELYTIGHSTHSTDIFADLLRAHQIGTVLDVRSVPWSQHVPQYNQSALASFLRRMGIRYHPMGKFFGARPENAQMYSKEGRADFDKMRKNTLFTDGVASVCRGLEQGHRIALMCSEKNPWDCHRAILVTRAFDLLGIRVLHILADGTLMTQQELDTLLVRKYFPQGAQMSLLSEGASDIGLIEQAYRRRGQEIAVVRNHFGAFGLQKM